MSMSDRFKRAWREVEEADLPEVVWAAAFAAALEESRPGASRPADEESHDDAQSPKSQDPAALLAARLRLNRDLIDAVFEFETGEVRIVAPSSRLPTQRAPAMRELALLVAGARQGAGIDDGWTSTQVIREVCREFGVLDSPNFASEIGKIDSLAFKGAGARRMVKVTARSFEMFADRVRAVAGG